jgi:hypothetical protein
MVSLAKIFLLYNYLCAEPQNVTRGNYLFRTANATGPLVTAFGLLVKTISAALYP